MKVAMLRFCAMLVWAMLVFWCWRFATMLASIMGWGFKYPESLAAWNKWIDEHWSEIDERQRRTLARYFETPFPYRYLKKVTMKEDPRGLLVRFHYRSHPSYRISPSRPTFVIVHDASHPERLHAIMVPRYCRSATKALAWTAGLSKRQYKNVTVEA